MNKRSALAIFAIAVLAAGASAAGVGCGDDTSTGGTGGTGGSGGQPSTSKSSASSSSVVSSSSGGPKCVGCADLMGGNPSTLCAGKSRMLYEEVAKCACTPPMGGASTSTSAVSAGVGSGASTGSGGSGKGPCADQCPCTMPGTPSNMKCDECVFVFCTDQVMECIMDHGPM